METATTIFEQLGGRRFQLMTGAKNLMGDNNSLTFKLPGTRDFVKNGINCIKIELTPMDTYTMTCYKIRGSKVATVETVEGIYADDLLSVFTSKTGLDTSL